MCGYGHGTQSFVLCMCVCVCTRTVLGLELRAYTLSHSTSPFFVMVFFEIGSGKLFALGWLKTVILLISAS
jgi:hypothetical protein